MKQYELDYFQSGKSLCGADFDNPTQKVIINLDLISSISETSSYNLPFSGVFRGKFATVKMNNNSNFFITEKVRETLLHKITYK